MRQLVVAVTWNKIAFPVRFSSCSQLGYILLKTNSSLGIMKIQTESWENTITESDKLRELQNGWNTVTVSVPASFCSRSCAWDVWSLGGSRFSPSVSLCKSKSKSTPSVSARRSWHQEPTLRISQNWKETSRLAWLTWLANIASGLWG